MPGYTLAARCLRVIGPQSPFLPRPAGSRCATAGWQLLSVFLVAVAMLSCLGVSAHAQGNPAQVKAHVKEILAQPEFRAESPDSPMAQLGRAFRDSWERASRWLQERWKAFQRWLEHLFSGLGGGAAGAVASIVPKVFAVVILVFGGWLIAWLIRNIVLHRRDSAAKARTAYDEAEEDEGVNPEPGAWIQQADVYANSEDYRRAFRAVFVAILLLLDEGGLIEFDRARTNGDYLRLLHRKNVRRLYDLLDPLVLEFDRRWYGRAETGAEDYKRIQQTFERVRALMTEPASSLTAAPGAAPGKA